MVKIFHIQLIIIISSLLSSQTLLAFNFDSLVNEVTKTVSEAVDSSSEKITDTLDELTGGKKEKKELQDKLEKERKKREALERKLAQKKYEQNNRERINQKTNRRNNKNREKNVASLDSSVGEFADIDGKVDMTSMDSSLTEQGNYNSDKDPNGTFADLAK